MPDRIVQSNNDCDMRTGQSLHSHESVWMAHWTRANAAPHIHNHLPRAFGSKGIDLYGKQSNMLGAEVASDFSKPAKGFGEKEATTFAVLNAGVTSSKNLGSERFPIFKLRRSGGRSLVSKNDTGATSHIVPYKEPKLDKGKRAAPFILCRPEETKQLFPPLPSEEHFPTHNLTILEDEHIYRSHSAFWGSEKKENGYSNSGKPVTLCQRYNKTSLFMDDPSAGNPKLPGVTREQYQRMQNGFNIGLLPSWSYPSERANVEKLYHGCCSLQRMPRPVDEVETMRICTTVDSVEGLPGGPPRYSQTTHSVLITKKTDVNLCEENQIFDESRLSSQYEGDTVCKRQRLSPLFGLGDHGARLQVLDSSLYSDGKETGEDPGVDMKNQLSNGIEAMDIDAFEKKNHFSGVNSSPSNKDMMLNANLLSEATIASSREEVGCSGRATELPDMNLELPALPATSSKIPDINLELPALPATTSSKDNPEATTSRTQSLDMELLLSHAEQPNSSKSNFPEGPIGPEPCSRWVKRLMLSSSDSFPLGTKSSNMCEAPSHGKVNKFFSKILKDGMTSSELKLDKCHGKELTALDHNTTSLMNGESSSADMVKKDQEITLSHFWIRRWRHNRDSTPPKKPESVVLCESQSSKVASEDLQKKQFPSIAAMALVGKATSGFQPCEMQNRGSFVVWDVKRF